MRLPASSATHKGIFLQPRARALRQAPRVKFPSHCHRPFSRVRTAGPSHLQPLHTELASALTEIRELQEKTKAAVADIITAFGEDPKKMASEDFFDTFRKFFDSIKVRATRSSLLARCPASPAVPTPLPGVSLRGG